MKTLLLVVASVMGLALAGLAIVPGAVDWDRFKAPIAEGLRTVTGRPVALDGEVRFSVLPVPTLSVERVRIGNPPGAVEPDLVRLGRLDARVALLPLFVGRIEVEDISLEHPELTLETLPGGRRGWLPAEAEPSASLPGTTRLDRIDIHDGTLVWRDDDAGVERRIAGLHARISAGSLSGPFELVGRGESAGLPFTLEAATGVVGEGTSTPVRVALASLDGAAALHFAGLVAAGDEPRLQGDLRAELTGSAAPLATAFGLAVPLPEPPVALHAALDAGRTAVSLTGMDIQAGATTLTGNARLTLTPAHPSLDLKLAAGRLEAGYWPDASPALLTAARALPPGLTVGLDLAVDALGLSRGELRQAALRARLTGGMLTLEHAGALGPGGSELTLSGTIAIGASGTPPAADLRLAAGTDNLRMLLDRLEIDSSGIAGDRLRSASLSGRLHGDGDGLALTGLELRLDTSRLSGDVAWRNQSRPRLTARLATDHLDVDAYAAALPPEQRRNLATALAARLAGFDLDLSARLDKLTLGGVAVRGLEMDAVAEQGALTLRSLRVADLAGFSLGVQGTIAGLEPAHGIDLSADAETVSPAAAERLLGISLPPPLRRLGPLKLGGHLAGDVARLTIVASAETDTGSAELTGDLAREDKRWRLYGLHGTVAGTALRGEAVIDPAASPALSLQLETGEIVLDRLWPETPHPALRRWSVDRLDFDWLNAGAAHLALTSAGLSLGDRRLGGASLAATLKDGRLELERLDGELMGGRVSAAGHLGRNPDGSGDAALNLTIRRARFNRGFFDGPPAPTVEVVAGTLDVDANLTCGGDSELALLGSLAGSGHVAIDGGRLLGVDLPGLLRRISALRHPDDVAVMLGPGHSETEGDTPFDRLEASLEIDHGMVAANSITLAAPAGSGEAEGMVDLPNRLLNLALHLHPADPTPLPAIGILITGGFDHPQRTVDTSELQDYFRRSLLGGPPP